MSKHIVVQNTYIFACILIVFMLFVFTFTPLNSAAQIIPGFENSIVLRTNPTNPGPNETVTISAESFSIDLDIATISWFINDVLQQQSVGEKVFQFSTSGLGSNSKIDVIAEIDGVILESNQILIRPTDIDILWQAQTFSHPLYKGKREASIGSMIAVEVVPHFVNSSGRKLKTDELVYSWKVDRKAVPRVSGKGKNTIVVSQTKPLNSLSVEVEVESIDKTLFSKRSLLLPIRSGELLIYENNPLFGILFNKATNNLYSLVGKETKFIAYPFFMSLVNRNDLHINYLWKLNNEPIDLGRDRGSITVSHSGTEEGNADISVSIRNSRDIFQESKAGFKVEFGGESTPGFSF